MAQNVGLDQISEMLREELERDMKVVAEFKRIALRRGWIVEVKSASDHQPKLPVAPSQVKTPGPSRVRAKGGSRRLKQRANEQKLLRVLRSMPPRSLSTSEIREELDRQGVALPEGRPDLALRRWLGNLVDQGAIKLDETSADKRANNYILLDRITSNGRASSMEIFSK